MVNWTILIAYNLPFYKNITKSEIVSKTISDLVMFFKYGVLL